ncbi:prepilin peptidase [Qiania dongpingensis]|uniref:prepilin peptidase n=1 Tax=Qiania dongpingensis TaxID=2763669 RepID=UPI0024B5C93D|nr:A24 family peptidase [Qiania dongpingensis]
MLLFYEILLGLLIFIAGACMFSFLNVIIYRVPRHMSFIKGFSMCPSCGHRLRAGDLVPVLSYLLLKGKCRYCKKSIGMRDTVIELLGGGAALLCAANYKEWPAALTVFLFFSVLTVTALIDADTMEIPDGCWIALAALAAVSVFTMDGVSIPSRIIGMICVSVPMLLVTLIVREAFGGGDIKLTAAAGLFLGWKLMLVSGAMAVFLGGGYGIFLLASGKKKRKDHFAFGPFLCVGMAAGILYGQPLIDWYLSFLLY